MHILLPPSAGKTPPAAGETPPNTGKTLPAADKTLPNTDKIPPGVEHPAPQCLELGALAYPQHLTEPRQELIQHLTELSHQPDALKRLGLGPRSSDDILHNQQLYTAPVAPAREIYTGVLYHAAQLDQLGQLGQLGQPAQLAQTTQAAQPGEPAQAAHAGSVNPPGADRTTWADEHILIASALWGWLRPGDPIPTYRLDMGVNLPPVGRLAPYWKPRLAFTTDTLAGELLIDCRSGAYRAAWLPTLAACRDHHLDLVEVRAVKVVDGVAKVISHNAKHWRGRVVHALLTSPHSAPQDPGDLPGLLTELLPDVADVRLEGGPHRWQLILVTQ